MIGLYAILGFVILCIATQWTYADEITIGIELLPSSVGVFELGISNKLYRLEDGSMEKEITIGLFFISVYITFYRNEA